MAEPEIVKPIVEDDDSLDNFFKKKDKKVKKKKTKKVDAGEDVSEIMTKPKKSDVEPKKEGQDEEPKTKEEQEEWIDFEDESKRDYSDLKIQNLQIGEEAPAPAVDVPEYNEAGELLPPRTEEGPWNKSVKSQEPEVQEEKKEVAPTPEPKRTGAYRPPQARSMGSSPGLGNLAPISMKRTRRHQKAPAINNELDFPSLEAAVKDTVEHKGFEMVKTGVKSSASWRMNQQQNQSTNISLGNQFSALNTQ